MFKIIKTLFRINAQENYLVLLEEKNQNLFQKSDQLEEQLKKQEERFTKLNELCDEMKQRTVCFEKISAEMKKTDDAMTKHFADSLATAEKIQKEVQGCLGNFHSEAQKKVDAVSEELERNNAGIKAIQQTLDHLLAEVAKLH